MTNQQIATLVMIHRKLREAKARRYFDVLDIAPCADALETILVELGEPPTPADKDWSKIFTVIR